jgi:PadR family transcriptional regulator PadR
VDAAGSTVLRGSGRRALVGLPQGGLRVHERTASTLAPMNTLWYKVFMTPDDQLISQMRRGALQYCVLALLRPRPRYGLELVKVLSETTSLTASEGTVYPLLSRLRLLGHVRTEWRDSPQGAARRYYALTEVGASALDGFEIAWAGFRDGVEGILKGSRSDDFNG